MRKERMLSLDISTTSTGYSFFEDGVYKESGVIAPKEKDWLERVIQMSKELQEKYPNGSIDTLVVENTFAKININTLKKLCMAQGIMIGALLYKNTELFQVYPKSWQSHYSLGNYKREELKKATLQRARDLTLKDEIKKDDEADAILIGLYAIEKL